MGGASHFLQQSRILLLLLLLAGPRGRPRDQTPPPHAADCPADEPGPPSAVRRGGTILPQQLQDPPQGDGRCLEDGGEKEFITIRPKKDYVQRQDRCDGFPLEQRNRK